MIRKLFRFFRGLLIGALWTYVYVIVADFVMQLLWNFNFLSARSWQTISRFWESGGVINTGKDFIFLLMLLMVPVLWVWGWRLLLRADYVAVLLWPLAAYNRHIIKKYGQDSKRIILRNIKSSQKIIEEIKDQLDSIKPAKSKEVGNIRNGVFEKLGEINKK